MNSRYIWINGGIVFLTFILFSGQACPPNTDDMMPAPAPVPGPAGEQGPQGPPGSDAAVTAGNGVTIQNGTVSLDTAFTDGLYWKRGGNAGTTAGTDVIGTTDDQALELHVNGARALRLEPNAIAPNLLGGFAGNTIDDGVVGATIAGGGDSDNGGADPKPNRVAGDFGTIGGGWGNQAGNDDGDTTSANSATVGGGASNTANARQATVGGGSANTASASAATIGGGRANTASGTRAIVGGGEQNTASGQLATVGGGFANMASANQATVGGGISNTASGLRATVGGGNSNTASGQSATVGGGAGNTASGSRAAVGGGASNTADGQWATVAGGNSNLAEGDYSFAAGRRAKATHEGSFVWGDSTNANVESFDDNTFSVRAKGGTRFYSSGNLSTGVELLAGGGAWQSLSDRNVKENFEKVDSREILERLAAIPIETWNYKAQDDSIRHIGPMAQDFHAAFAVGHDDKHIGTIDADGVALAAIQGLHDIVKQRERELATQNREIHALQARLTALEGLVKKLATERAPIE